MEEDKCIEVGLLPLNAGRVLGPRPSGQNVSIHHKDVKRDMSSSGGVDYMNSMWLEEKRGYHFGAKVVFYHVNN